jgi:hypothetical protein
MQTNDFGRAADILRAVVAYPPTDEETRGSALSWLEEMKAKTDRAATEDSVLSFDDAVATALEIDDELVVA